MPSPELQMFAAAAALPQFFLLVLWSSSRGNQLKSCRLGEKAPKDFIGLVILRMALQTNMLVCLILISSYIASGRVSHWI